MSHGSRSDPLTPEDCTTAIGLFNFARSYWRSAEHLRASKIDVSHPDAPMLFLLYQAIELYLKAFLRNAGYDLQQLKSISHRIIKAGREAQTAGLQLTEADFELLDLIDSYDNVMRTRYITTGAHTRPEDTELSEFCQHLDQDVGKRMISDGHPIRAQGFSPPVKALTGRPLEEGLSEEIDTLSKSEREIIAYLLHRKQRMFTCNVDGGHAATLISRGIVRRALRPGQVFEYDAMPVEVPLEVWRFRRANANKFPMTVTRTNRILGGNIGWSECGTESRPASEWRCGWQSYLGHSRPASRPHETTSIRPFSRFVARRLRQSGDYRKHLEPHRGRYSALVGG
jgi:hypothetical protein